jgi:D-inositol-3-phosphate glycosyltransferase
MKVAIVVPAIHDGGGVPTVVRYMWDILSDRYDCRIISISTSKADAFSLRIADPATWLKGVQTGQSQWQGKPVTDVGAWATEIEFLRYCPRRVLTELLSQFDIIQVVAGAPAWAYVAKNAGKPVFLQVATLVREERRKLIAEARGLRKCYLQFTTAVVSRIEELALKHVNLVFVENFWMQAHMQTRLGESGVVLAPPGVDSNIYHPAANLSATREKYLLSVGRFNDERKNVALMFKAYARLRQIVADAPRLLLAGLSGPNPADWDLARQLGILDAVEFRQDLSQQALVELLQQAQVFVCSSAEEGLGLAMLEALACGIPVVTTRCGGPEVFMRHGVNGFLTANYDVEDMAEHLARIVTDEDLRARMAVMARSIVEAEFCKTATAQAFLNAYAEYDN